MKQSIFSSEEFVPPKTLEYDLVIVGTGAGGAEAARHLSKHFKVALIEEGPFRKTEDFKMLESMAFPELYQDGGARMTADGAIKILQGKSVGGSTTVNWTSSFRIPSRTLEYWNKNYGIKSLTAESLSEHFDKIEKQYSIERWSGTPNQNNQKLADGMEKLGIQYGVIPRNVKGCYDLGHCGHGCPTGAKQSTLVNALPDALAQGAHLYCQFRAMKLVEKGELIHEIEAYPVTATGKLTIKDPLRIKAKQFIVCGGGINTPILLMRSHIPDPFGNLGKRTFLHPVSVSLARFSESIDGFSGAPQSIYSDYFLWPDDDRMGFKIESAPIHPALTSSLLHLHGKASSEIMQGFRHFQAAIALGRDGFHPDAPGGRVVMLSEGRFALDYPWNSYLVESYQRSLKTLASIQFAAGALEVYPLHRHSSLFKSIIEVENFINKSSTSKYDLSVVSAHVMGGAAMGIDEKNSVVDNKGRHHQIENLYIFDGSLFPTSLGVNPTESILAISSLLSHQFILDNK
ncbi:MAG: GMC family oxidoreductase [Bdellovibrio sp.]